MHKTVTLALLAIAGSLSITAFAADREIKVDDRLDAAADTLHDMMNASDHGIPHDLLDKAKCVVIVPGMKKAGFIIGAKYGRGLQSAATQAEPVGARRLRSRLKVAASGSRSEPRKLMSYCLS